MKSLKKSSRPKYHHKFWHMGILLTLLILGMVSEAHARRLIYKEEFYRIYYLPQLYANDDLTRVIRYLEWAEKAPFAPPIQALKPHEDETDYVRYQKLLQLHIYYLLCKSTAKLAARFDKHRPVFFNLPYKDDILKSLTIAEHLYNQALYYWEQVRINFAQNRKQKGRAEVEFLEKLMDDIQLREIDLGSTINRKLSTLKITRAYFENNGDQTIAPLPEVEPPR